MLFFVFFSCSSNENGEVSRESEKPLSPTASAQLRSGIPTATVIPKSPTPEIETFKYNEYNVSMEYFPEERKMSGIQSVVYKNDTGEPLYKICFNLYLNAFDSETTFKPYFNAERNTIYKYGEDYGNINIINTWANGNTCSYSLKGTVLTIYLPFLLEPDEIVFMDIHFEAKIPKISHRTGVNDNAAWFGNFIPILAVYDKTEKTWLTTPYFPAGRPFYSNISNYNVKITTPENYLVVGTGDAASTISGNKRTTVLTAKMTRDFAFAISSEYMKIEGRSDSGVYVNLYHYSDVSQESLDNLILRVKDCIDFFSKNIGSYPYKIINIAENGNYVDTSVYPQMIFLSSTNILNENHENIAFSTIVGVARQWFYNVVGNNQITEAWLSEGLSIFTAYTYLYKDDYETLKKVMKEKYRTLSSSYKNLKNTSLSDDISVYSSNYAYNSIQGTKGALMFFALREKLGSQKYGEFLKIYYRNNYLNIATRKSVERAAEEAYGESLGDFFEKWIDSTELPELFTQTEVKR